jgi:hypothetical protein
MVASCRTIVASDLSDQAKEAACLLVLQDHVGGIALSRFSCCDGEHRGRNKGGGTSTV